MSCSYPSLLLPPFRFTSRNLIFRVQIKLSQAIFVESAQVIARRTEIVDSRQFILQEPESRMEVPPNQTIYINNLNEKVKKEGECKEIFKYMSIILGKTTLRLSELCDKCRLSRML